MTIKKVLGVDVSKSSVTCHLLDSYPKGGLRTYWDKTRNKASTLYPVFYSNPDKKKHQKSAFEFASFVEEAKPDLAILEPTGNHYSRIWSVILNNLNVKILWVGHVELRRFRGGKNLPNKSDSADSLAMAAYPHDPDHILENGELNLKYFLIHRPDEINRIRELCQQLEHLNRVKSPIVNYSRQILSWQFPEIAHNKSQNVANVPPLWGWLSNHPDTSKSAITRFNNAHKSSIAKAHGIEIDPFLRQHARWICDIEITEKNIESELNDLLKLEQFTPYTKVFNLFGFGVRIQSRILSRVYPFESFLGSNGLPVIEHESRLVKKIERDRKDGQTVIKKAVGDHKRVKRNRSRDCFKMRLGMGTVLEQSGDTLIEKPSGSSLCRMSFWQFTLCQVEPEKLPKNDLTKKLIDYKNSLKETKSSQGEQLLNGKHLQGKIMSKVANLLYEQLLKELVKVER